MARSMHKGINEKTQYACTNLYIINQFFSRWLVVKLYKKQSNHLEFWNTDIYVYKKKSKYVAY